MKAVVYDRYGPPEVLHLAELPAPAPSSGEMLIRVRAATVAAGDVRLRKPDPFAARLYNGLDRPRRVRILGFEMAGQVAAVGKDVRRFKEGDAIFSFTGFRFGSYAQYRCLPESGTVRTGLVAFKPSAMSFEEAAAVPCGALTALAFLRRGNVHKGQRVLIYGASGSVGTYAIQLARHFGADVTGVCSAANLDLVRSLGASRVVDYTSQDFARGNGTYDIVFDAVGLTSASHSRPCMAKNGVFLSVRGDAKVLPEDLAAIRELVEADRLKAVIDRTYRIEDIVEAHRYVELGHKRGNVVITIDSGAGA